ncbi:MAG: toll/interleukin-1 receptor domain-containing protein [Lewinellaceae bacterium]|nr:toll/interleukin-1 receptor domain-containing protein [Lewinellaceae bacterium]
MKNSLHNNINAWIDEKDLIPGQDWKLEIEIALTRSNIVLICLSNNSISKVGFVQKEIKYALDKFEEYPEGIIYIMPIRLEDCILPFSFERRA